jgi:hypothetical protein
MPIPRAHEIHRLISEKTLENYQTHELKRLRDGIEEFLNEGFNGPNRSSALVFTQGSIRTCWTRGGEKHRVGIELTIGIDEDDDSRMQGVGRFEAALYRW